MEKKTIEVGWLCFKLGMVAFSAFLSGPWFALALVAVFELIDITAALEKIAESTLLTCSFDSEEPDSVSCKDCEFFQEKSEPKEVQHGSATEESELNKNG